MGKEEENKEKKPEYPPLFHLLTNLTGSKKKKGESEEEINIKKLELAQKIREYHHNALWEEEKHYTWLISIVFSAQLIIFASQNIDVSIKSILIILLSFVGMVFALTGFRVQRKEGRYFMDANARFVEAHNKVYAKPDLKPPSDTPNMGIIILFIKFFLNKLGVRDFFQFIFLFFILIYIVMIVLVII